MRAEKLSIVSAHIQIFIKAAKPIDQIAPMIGAFLGTDLVVNPSAVGVVYEGMIKEMWIVVFDASGFEDDQGIEFSQYRVCIELGPLREEPIYDEWLRMVALSLASHLRSHLNSATMVTSNLQRLIQRFPL